MPARQLHLFEPARPLLQRFGPAFFKSAPAGPGIYIMSGENDRVLYIGQSANLRRRLASYKNARPDRAPRKIIRLVHSVRALVWEECATPQAAVLRETQLLHLHRPKFNVQNTYPAPPWFISVDLAPDTLALSLTRAPRSEAPSFGPFKSSAIRAFAALLRLLWAVRHQPRTPHDFPRRLIGDKPPREFLVATASAAIFHQLTAFLSGESDALLASLTADLPASAHTPTFLNGFFAADLEILTEFYQAGRRRNGTGANSPGAGVRAAHPPAQLPYSSW